MELAGKTINFLGDSITEGAGTSGPEQVYTEVMRRMYGLRAANNYGIGGSRIARQLTVTAERYDRDFCLRVEEMDPAADAVVIFGGSNDYGHGEAPLGVPGDRQPDTFYGACHYLMGRLMELYTGKPVVIVTPLHRLDENNPRGDGRKPRSVAPLRVYRDILMETACYYGFPVLDLYAMSGIQPENQACRERLCPDGLHPNDAGHQILARMIGQFLQTL